MPRYHFHIQDGEDQPDPVGTVLTGLDEARSQAVRFAADLLKEAAPHFWADGEWSMTVTDDRQMTLFSLTVIGHDAPALAAMPMPLSRSAA